MQRDPIRLVRMVNEMESTMSPVPFYTPAADRGAYQLRYAWTGWPSSKQFPEQPVQLIEEAKRDWESDHLRVQEYRWTRKQVQILFSATPDVFPAFVAARAKGRLDHALRSAGYDMPFSRKVGLRSTGDNTRRDVERYIARQVAKEQFADEDFAAKMAEFTVTNSDVDLSQPAESARGRYWYNLHVVLITDDRFRITDTEFLRSIRDGCLKVAAKKGHLISRLSVMPDHLHIAMRPGINDAPLDIIYAYQNNLAYLVRQQRIWCDGYYVGTFGEYTTRAVHRLAGEASRSSNYSDPPSAQGGWGRRGP